jgi:hypothetical protein
MRLLQKIEYLIHHCGHLVYNVIYTELTNSKINILLSVFSSSI